VINWCSTAYNIMY